MVYRKQPDKKKGLNISILWEQKKIITKPYNKWMWELWKQNKKNLNTKKNKVNNLFKEKKNYNFKRILKSKKFEMEPFKGRRYYKINEIMLLEWGR